MNLCFYHCVLLQLLTNLLQQQTDNDALINKVQLDRDTERSKLIKDIVKGNTLY